MLEIGSVKSQGIKKIGWWDGTGNEYKDQLARI